MVTSGLQTMVKTGITIVSYFGNVTASLFALTIVRKFTPWRSKTIQTNYSYMNVAPRITMNTNGGTEN